MNYEILIKGTPVDSGEDDIHTGATMEDLVDATVCYGHLLRGEIRNAGFSPGPYGGAYVYLYHGGTPTSGGRIHGGKLLSEGRIPVTDQSPLPEEDNTDEVWRREMAMEAGMAFGTAGYNDAMGYEVGLHKEG